MRLVGQFAGENNAAFGVDDHERHFCQRQVPDLDIDPAADGDGGEEFPDECRTAVPGFQGDYVRVAEPAVGGDLVDAIGDVVRLVLTVESM